MQYVLRQEPFFEQLSANNNCMLTRWTECSQASANTRTHAHTHEYVRTWLVSAELCMLTILTHAYMHVLLCMCKVIVIGFFTILLYMRESAWLYRVACYKRVCMYIDSCIHSFPTVHVFLIIGNNVRVLYKSFHLTALWSWVECDNWYLNTVAPLDLYKCC